MKSIPSIPNIPKTSKKSCPFCTGKRAYIDYKNIHEIKKYMTFYAKIKPRYYTGVCLKHQKNLSTAIKKARIMGLLPFIK